MSSPNYYVKNVRRNDDRQITRVKTSKNLEGRPGKMLKRKKVVKHSKKEGYQDDLVTRAC